jgi:hypothetical protein
MATKPKDSSTVVGNEKKKTPSSNSPLTTAKRTTKPSTTTTTTSTTNKSNSTTPSEKNNPNYLKPTTSFRKPKTETPIKPSPIRRRSLDKPLSSSNLTAKTTQPSASRLHKALVSPGPRERSHSLNIRSSNPQVKGSNPSKPISDKAPSDAKTKLVWKRATKKINTPNNNIATSNTTKKVANDHASSANPTKTKAVITDSDSSNVETEDVKEVTDQEAEVIKVENKDHASNVISTDVHSEFVHEHENDQVLKDSDQPQNQDDDEKVISTVSEEEIAEKEPQGEKSEVEHEEKQTNSGNHPGEVDHSEVAANEKEEHESGIVIEDQKSENHQKEVDHSEVEREAAVNEKEENESGIVIEDQKGENNNEEQNENKNEEKPEVEHEEKQNNSENHQEVDHSEVEREAAANEKDENESGIVIEDKKSEDNNEEERGGEEKEAVEGGVSKEVEEAKAEVAQPKQQLAAKGKNESQVSNDMIEETASKLLGRKNKVLALAGAFQTVIDHQAK